MIIDFPNELLLELFSLLPLKSLIFARSVSRNWRRLVPLSHLIPARRALLDLYDHVITHPHFLDTRSSTFAALRPNFNREKYIADLDSTHPCLLPEEFRLWVLEWPEKAVFGWVWPGLEHELLDTRGRFEGYNSLAMGEVLDIAVDLVEIEKTSPRLSLSPDDKLWYLDFVAIICIRSHGRLGHDHVVLVVDKKRMDSRLYGTLHNLYGNDFETYDGLDASTWVSWLRGLIDEEVAGEDLH